MVTDSSRVMPSFQSAARNSNRTLNLSRLGGQIKAADEKTRGGEVKIAATP
jgi:hypothetical protein